MISASVPNSEPVLNLLLQRDADVNIKSKAPPLKIHMLQHFISITHLTIFIRVDNNGQVSQTLSSFQAISTEMMTYQTTWTRCPYVCGNTSNTNPRQPSTSSPPKRTSTSPVSSSTPSPQPQPASAIAAASILSTVPQPSAQRPWLRSC